MGKKPRYFAGDDESAKRLGSSRPPKEIPGDKPDPKSRSFYYDEVDEFQHDKDKVLLSGAQAAKKGRRGWKALKSKQTVEEVLPVVASSDEEEISDEDDESDVDMESDLDSNEEYLPSADAWGKKRSAYYNTDYVDKDYGGFSGSEEEEAATLEETEAKVLQRKHLELMSEEDFELDSAPIPSTSAPKIETSAKVTEFPSNLATLSDADKLKVFKAQSPEYFELLADFKQKKSLLHKINDLLGLVTLESGWSEYPLIKFFGNFANILANYVVVLNFYFMLKVKKEKTRYHPVIERIAQWQELIAAANAKAAFDDSTVEAVLERLRNGESLDQLLGGFRVKRMTHNRILKSSRKSGVAKITDDAAENVYAYDDDGKRGITYQMSKNKGLMARRKKEQNNPRVKHKLKYRKALIKRRSQVPDCKTEMERYGGEARGIKIGVIRSRKLQ